MKLLLLAPAIHMRVSGSSPGTRSVAGRSGLEDLTRKVLTPSTLAL